MHGIRMCFLFVFCFASASSWGGASWHTDLGRAQSEAKSTGKPIMILFTGSDWCPYCIKLEDEVLDKREFVTWANDSVVLLKLDRTRRKKMKKSEEKQYASLSKKYGVRGVPKVVFIDQSEKVIGTSGYLRTKGPEAWVSNAGMILRNHKPTATTPRPSAAGQAKKGSRTWTDFKGRTLDGVLYSRGAGQVKIKTAEGKIISIRQDQLSEQDQVFLKGR